MRKHFPVLIGLVSLSLLMTAVLTTFLNWGSIKPQYRAPSYDLFMTNAIIKTFQPNGHLSILIRTPRATHSRPLKKTFLEKPSAILYSEKNPPWRSHSNNGSRTDQSHITHLWGHVVLIQAQPSAPDQTEIRMQELTYYPNKHTAITRTLTHYQRANLKLAGKGAIVNFKTNEVKLQCQSKFHYSPTQKTQ